jgi:hypothetical protein
MATSIAAGASALLMQAQPSLKGNPVGVRNALFQTASNDGEQSTTDGYGKLDVLAALNLVLNPTPIPLPSPMFASTPLPITTKDLLK